MKTIQKSDENWPSYQRNVSMVYSMLNLLLQLIWHCESIARKSREKLLQLVSELTCGSLIRGLVH